MSLLLQMKNSGKIVTNLVSLKLIQKVYNSMFCSLIKTEVAHWQLLDTNLIKEDDPLEFDR
jgi:hypothetical protein